jgi:MraZ protein
MEGEKLEGTRPPIYGTDDGALDGKHRLILSKRKREWLSGQFRFLKGELGVLEIIPEDAFLELHEWVVSHSRTNRGRRMYQAMVLATAEGPFNCDAEGRIVVPTAIRNQMDLKGELEVIGAGDRIQVWTKADRNVFNRNPSSLNSEWQQLVEEAILQMEQEEKASRA